MTADRFTAQWRDEHAELGDAALKDAHEQLVRARFSELTDCLSGPDSRDHLLMANALAAVAQAHYAAANTRARPMPSAEEQAGVDLAKMWLMGRPGDGRLAT